MNVQDILASLDGEISRLRQARELLAPLAGEAVHGPGQPKGAGNTQPTATTPKQVRKRRLTPEGKQRIRDAQNARWAAKKSTAEPLPATEEVTADQPLAETLVEM